MKRVLFLCVGNSCRSQMAEGFARELGKDILEPASAGTKPARDVANLAVEVMKEKSIDISGQRPKVLTDKMVKEADILISMGCGVEKSCPVIYLDMFEDWNIEDPYRMPIEEYRRARDEIEKKIRALLKRIH